MRAVPYLRRTARGGAVALSCVSLLLGACAAEEIGTGEEDRVEVGEGAAALARDSGRPRRVGFRLLSKFTGAGGPIAESVSASPDGAVLVHTSSTEGSVGFVSIRDPARPIALGTVDVSGAVASGLGKPTSVAITPNGRYALVTVVDTADPIANADPGALVFIDMNTGGLVGAVTVGVGPDSVRVAPDGRKAILAIEDEEDPDGNGVAQARPGSVQIVTLDYRVPSRSQVTTLELELTHGNLPGDPQPEFVDIAADGRTAIVSLQENNLVAVIDLRRERVLRTIDAGTSRHGRADLAADGLFGLADGGFVGQLQPDGVCFLSDGNHFVTANEGDTPNDAFGAGLWAGGRGFSVFRVAGDRVFDSGDAAERRALLAGAYPEGRSEDRGIEFEGCATGVFGGTDYAFLLAERSSSLLVADMSNPSAPVITQLLGAPMRPESAVTIPARGLVAVAGEGDGVGGGIWLYRAVRDPADGGHGHGVHDARSAAIPFSALGALAYDRATGHLLATPDNAFAGQRVWSFRIDPRAERVDLVRELLLRDASGAELIGYDPEGIATNPEGGIIIASEGVARNGGSTTCQATAGSNRLLFFDDAGRLDPRYGRGGIVDLPCGSDRNAIDWTRMSANGFEGVAAVDRMPGRPGRGLKVYVAFQRALQGEGQNARIGEYDVDTGTWDFYHYILDPNPGGDAGNTFLSELIHVAGDTFAVIERDQGWAGAATDKTIRTFRLSSGAPNDVTRPVEKRLAIDLLRHPFRFDQEKIEGMALAGGSLWVTNDNDGGEAMNFFLEIGLPRELRALLPPL